MPAERGLRQLGPTHQRAFAVRYDSLVAQGQASNPELANGHKRDYYQRRSFNLVTAFATHRQAILRYMYDLDVAFTNNQAERDLRPIKLAHQAAPQDLGMLPQPARRRAIRPSTQLPVHHTQARRSRHRRPHPPVRRRPMDAAPTDDLNSYERPHPWPTKVPTSRT